MSPVPPAGVETVPPVDPEASVETEKAGPEGPEGPEGPAPTGSTTTDEATTTPVPTKVDAYKPRGIRSNHSPLDLIPVLLRIITAVFTLIAFAVIGSNKATVLTLNTDFNFISSDTVRFNDFFFFSYLLTVNVLAFIYTVVATLLALFLLTKNLTSYTTLISLFAVDLILSYLLISASTSAATGVRIYKPTLDAAGVPSSFLSKAYAATAFSFLAFFTLAAAALLSGLRAARRQ